MSRFLVDSTVWIEYFRGGNEAVNAFLTPLIEEDRIYFNGIILSELLIGANTIKEFEFLQKNFEGLRRLDTDKDTFTKTAQFGYQLRRKGMTVPLTDLIIAAHSNQHDLTIATSDPHFKLIHGIYKLKLEFFGQM